MTSKMHIDDRQKLMQVPDGLKRKILVYRNNYKGGDIGREKNKLHLKKIMSTFCSYCIILCLRYLCLSYCIILYYSHNASYVLSDDLVKDVMIGDFIEEKDANQLHKGLL